MSALYIDSKGADYWKQPDDHNYAEYRNHYVNVCYELLKHNCKSEGNGIAVYVGCEVDPDRNELPEHIDEKHDYSAQNYSKSQHCSAATDTAKAFVIRI